MILNHLKRNLPWNVFKSIVSNYMGVAETDKFQTSASFDCFSSVFSGLCLCLTITSLVLWGVVATAVTVFILRYLATWDIVKYSQVLVVEKQYLKMFLNSGCHFPFRCQLKEFDLFQECLCEKAVCLLLLLNCFPDAFPSKSWFSTGIFCRIRDTCFSLNSNKPNFRQQI